LGVGELVFVGLGLNDEKDLSIKGLEAVRSAESVFVELYTSLMGGFSLERLEKMCGRKVAVLSRHNLEEEEGDILLEKASKGRVVLMVPGDPFISTTHVNLRLKAVRKGLKIRVIHGASILSAVIGLTGLQNYKFGRSVTIPFVDSAYLPESPYRVIQENRASGLHTLCFLDVRADEGRYMCVNEAIEILFRIEQEYGAGVVTPDTLAVGVARAGSEKPVLKAEYIEELKDYDFGPPPQTLIFPGRLHFMEAEALIVFAGAPENIRRLVG